MILSDTLKTNARYDHDGDGYITQDEMKRYLVWSMRATGVKDVQEAAHRATINCFRTSDR